MSNPSLKTLKEQFGPYLEHDGKPLSRLRDLKAAMDTAHTADHVDDVLDFANKIIGGHGVEAVQGDWHNRFYQDIVLLYVNVGDPYAATLIYNAVDDKWYATSLGDLLENDRFVKRLGIR